MRLILFDIDGTILLTDGAGRRAIHRALLEEMGTAGPIDTYRFDGKTDPQIVRELLTHAGHPEASRADRVQAVCDRYVGLLASELGRPTQQSRLMAGITDLLAALTQYETERRALVGLLTGNVARGAELKLRSVGIAPTRFALGAYGSDAAHRPELPDIAPPRRGTARQSAHGPGCRDRRRHAGRCRLRQSHRRQDGRGRDRSVRRGGASSRRRDPCLR